MFKCAVRRGLAATLMTLAGASCWAGTAAANGPCGQDWDGNSACAVNSASTPSYSGSLTTDNENDYYVFSAAAGTELTVTVNDTENPQCPQDGYCGDVQAGLYDSQGNGLDEDTGQSSPNNGIDVPRTFSTTLNSAGTYYLIVQGDLGSDQYGNPTAVPYTLTVSASPAVQWPAPAPPAPPAPAPSPPPPPPACTVPHYNIGAALSSVEQHVVAHHCTVGAVSYRYDRFVRKGRVLALYPHAGTKLSNSAAVSIVVSRGAKPRRRGHHG